MKNLKSFCFLFTFLGLIFVGHVSGTDLERLRKKIKNQEAPSWMMRQIKADLASFVDTGIMPCKFDDLIDRHAKKRDDQIVRYQIFNGVLTITYSYELPQCARLKKLTSHLAVLASITRLPDVDFIVSLEDTADTFHKNYQTEIPIFVFAKHITSSRVILIPDAITLNGCDKLLKESRQGSAFYPWNQKKSKLFWRGASTGDILTVKSLMDLPRIKLIELSLKYPKLIDARLTSLCQMDDAMVQVLENRGFKGERIPIWKHMKYKFQLLIDGNSSAYERAYWQLFSNSVILKQVSENMQWYYNELQPYIHFIPVANNLHDLVDQIEWAKKNEPSVKKIIKNANEFAQKNLSYDDMLLYIYLLLTEYSKLQKF